MPQLLNEAELESYLFDLLSKKEIINEEFSGTPFRQVNIKGYGTADIIALDLDHDPRKPIINVNIVELKKGDIDFNAIGQICRYKKAIDRLIDKNIQIVKHFQIDVRGYLIGSEIGQGDVCYLYENIPWLTIMKYSISLDKGLILDSESRGWYNVDEDFTDLEANFMHFFHREIKPKYKELLLQTEKHWILRNK